MHGDYGYLEEGQLGKPYDLSLLKRFAPYISRYLKSIGIALALALVVTIFDLAVPYLSKVAIDRFILASWHVVDISDLGRKERRELLERHQRVFHPTAQPSVFALTHENLRALDPALLNRFREAGILQDIRFTRTDGDVFRKLAEKTGYAGTVILADRDVLVPENLVERLSPEEKKQLRSGDLRGLSLVAVVFTMLVIASFGLRYAEHFLLELTGQRVMFDIRADLFSKMQRQSVRFFDRNPVGRLVTRVANDIENLNEMFKTVLVTVFKDLLLLLGIMVVVIYLDRRLAVWVFACIPLVFVLTLIFSTLAREAFRELRSAVAALNSFVQERVSGMRVVQLFVTEVFQKERFERVNHRNFTAGMRQIRIFAVFMPLMELIASCAVALLIWYGGGQVVQERLSLGALVAFIAYTQMFFRPIRDMAEKYNIMQSAMASGERIFEIMDLDDELPEASNSHTPAEVTGHLIFKDVTFAYNEGVPVLRGISFEIRQGETVAIVGATGSGKTTVLNLAARLYDPDDGAILLDGVDLRRWDKSSLHGAIGVVTQDVIVFSGTVRENIAFGRNDLGERSVERAARSANASEFIGRLPGGMDEKPGEGGSGLSAGERQLLTFARALAHDPPLLLLDEATSHIDPGTERLIQDAVLREARNRTLMVVAHRLSTVVEADRILVMKQGRIVEQGTHEELLKSGSLYRKLHHLLAP